MDRWVVNGIIGLILPYAAFGVFLAGMTWRLWTWARAAVPLRIPTTPAPKAVRGVVLRMLSEVLLFRSLFRDRKGFWLGAWVFHVSLAIVLLGHVRFFVYPVPACLTYLRPAVSHAGYLLLASVFFLFLRHLADEKDVYLLTWRDLFPLAMLMAIGGTGASLRTVARTDLLAVKDYLLGLIAFHPAPFPPGGMFLLHFSLVVVFLAYLPFSKLVHGPGMLFSPTRNQRNNVETRFVNPWDSGERAP